MAQEIEFDRYYSCLNLKALPLNFHVIFIIKNSHTPTDFDFRGDVNLLTMGEWTSGSWKSQDIFLKSRK